jgi:hypothetical protein
MDLTEINLQKGMTDKELEFLACEQNANKGASLWLFPSAEVHSQGKLYRQKAFIPSFLPLNVFSDHGVSVGGLTQSEIDSPARIHLTYNTDKMAKLKHKKTVFIEHPWISYRKRKMYYPLKSANGTLVFISHSTICSYYKENKDKYFKDLKLLPEKYKPLVLCMHMHDILNGNHREYRKYGIPIVSAGHTSDINFVDRFYKIAINFKYSTSSAIGSHTYYMSEMGIPFFLYGEKPKHINISNPELNHGEIKYIDKSINERIKLAESLFMPKSDHVTYGQKLLCEKVLGLNSRLPRIVFAFILWRELFRAFPTIISHYCKWYIFPFIRVYLLRSKVKTKKLVLIVLKATGIYTLINKFKDLGRK